ncbi:cell wall metabolism sensor histidine kinase WalK [Patescibacteria group bacterium]|nr:cell wall metabolism sensor histidine kinase WalK [Patescibacteria group bacterium]
MFKNLKLGSKLILIVGSLIVCSVAISGVIFYYNIAKNTLTERTVAQLESIIVLKENQLNFFAERSTEDIKGLADEKSLVNNFKKLQKAYVSQEADGMVYSENIKQLFKERLAHKESFIEFFALDLNGKILTSTNETRVGKIRSNEIYFLHGIRGSYYQNFYYDKDLHQPAITVSAPIKNDEGKTIGVLAGRINIEKISDIITERSGLGETGETYLVNKFNLLVSKSRFIKGIEFEKVIHTEGVKNCLKGTFDTYNNDYRNIPVIGLHKWLAEKEVCLLAKIDQDEVFELAKETKNIIFLISLGIILLAIIPGSLLSRRITKPIEHLTATTRAIADGDLTKRAEVISKDEIGQLAAAFNEMTTKLKASYTGLEKKIKERTLQIEHEKSKLETTLESIGDGAFVVDKKGIITFFNKIAEELSGFSAKEALGKPYKDIIEIVREKDRTENYTFIETALQKGKIAHITNHSLMITKDGRTIAVADSASPIKKPNGEIIGCIGCSVT